MSLGARASAPQLQNQSPLSHTQKSMQIEFAAIGEGLWGGGGLRPLSVCKQRWSRGPWSRGRHTVTGGGAVGLGVEATGLLAYPWSWSGEVQTGTRSSGHRWAKLEGSNINCI